MDRPRISAACSDGQPGEDAKLNELGLDRVFLGELLQGLVEGQQVVVGLGRGRLAPCRGRPGAVAAALQPVTAAGVLDQDSTHGLGRRGEEMTAAVPGPIGIDADQTQVGLVDERRRLQGLAGRLARQPLRGQPPQLVVDQRQQLASRPRLARPRPVVGMAASG